MDKPIIEHPDVQRLVKQAVLDGFKIKELKAEIADVKEKIKQIHDIVSGSFSDSKTVSMIYEITKA